MSDVENPAAVKRDVQPLDKDRSAEYAPAGAVGHEVARLKARIAELEATGPVARLQHEIHRREAAIKVLVAYAKRMQAMAPSLREQEMHFNYAQVKKPGVSQATLVLDLIKKELEEWGIE